MKWRKTLHQLKNFGHNIYSPYINTFDYIELFADYKGRYNLRALILSRRTKYDYDTCINFINRYDDIEFGNCQLEFYDLWLIDFVVNNLREDE